MTSVLEVNHKLEGASGEGAKLILEKCNSVFPKNNGEHFK